MTDRSEVAGAAQPSHADAGPGAAVLLFVPASGPTGSGEYYRCLSIARAVHRRAPKLAVHFLLSEHARVEREEAFRYHLIPATPSRAAGEVAGLLDELCPDLAVFDCSGRARHFRRLARAGCRVIWISDRPGKRRRGFSPRVIPNLHRHIIAGAEFEPPVLSVLERGLLRCLGNGRISFIGAITPELAELSSAEDPAWAGLPADYAIFVAGGGGYTWQGQPVPEILVAAAAEFHRRTNLAAVVVLGPQYTGRIQAPPGVWVVPSLPTEALSRRLAGARLCVAGAGYMLSSQVLHARRPSVLVAVGGSDQPERVRSLSRQGLVLAASLREAELVAQAERLYREQDLAERMIQAIAEKGIGNDVGRVAELLLADLESASDGA